MKKGIFNFMLLFFVQISFGQSAIHTEKRGQGNPLIFLPGFTSPGSVWDETIKQLPESYESHLISYAGFDGLPPIETPWYEALKKGIATYIEEGDLTNITLIGHSMGGNLAIDIAAEFPERVNGLILVESIPCMLELMLPEVPASSLQYNSPYNKSVLEMSKEDFKTMASGMAQMMTSDSSKMEMLTDWAVKSDRKTYAFGYTDLLKLDLRETLMKINISTLILGASFPDKEVIQTNYEKQYANLRNKELYLIDDSKHFIMFDQPQKLSGQIIKYLEKHVK